MIGSTHCFTAEVDLQMVGTIRYHAIRLPVEVQSAIAFPSGVKQRFEGSINGKDFEGALMPTGTGRYYMMLSGALRKKLGLELGDQVEVVITIVDPSQVDVPSDVIEALSAKEDLLFKWEALSAGSKRGILHQINTAKTETTRGSRIQNLISRLDAAQPFEPFTLRIRL